MQLKEIPIDQAIPADRQELWQERCSIMEFDGKLSPEEAEWQAFLCVCGAGGAMGQSHDQQPHAREGERNAKHLHRRIAP